ncbi:MAG: hypothetical protein WAQ25_04420 [Candidatus Saccharimonas sp.]
METVGNWLAWLAHGVAWVQVVWFLAACAIGIPWIIWDEIRLKRTAPKPAEVAAYADQLELPTAPMRSASSGRPCMTPGRMATSRPDASSRRCQGNWCGGWWSVSW